MSSNPGILLISDGWPAADMAGISQTLYNLLQNYEGPLWMLMPEGEPIPGEPRLEMTELRYLDGPYKPTSSRIGQWINALIMRKQLNWRERKWTLPKQFPGINEAIVIVSTTDYSKLHVGWLLQRMGYTVIPYFMDDWLAGNDTKWKGNSLQKIARDILDNAPAWLVISSNLEAILRSRYGLKKRPTLVVHNPSPLLPVTGDDFKAHDKPEAKNPAGLSLVYAGSIWPMHADALGAMATAVQLLRKQGRPFSLDIYTSEQAWKRNKKVLDLDGVHYRGYLPYEKIHAALNNADLLLITASFLEAYEPFTNSSIQTKLTDYMAVGKALLYVGPLNGASAGFIHEWDCGFTIGTQKPGDIAEQLQAIAAMPELSKRKGINGLAAAKGYHSTVVVQQRLFAFLYEYCLLPLPLHT